MTVVLTCKSCAGALPPPSSDSPFVACSYCGTTHAIDAQKIELAPRAATETDRDRMRADADAAWDVAHANSKDPVVALRAVIAVRSGDLKTELEVERAARLGQALLTGFDTENKTRAIEEKKVALRMAEAAVSAVIELRRGGEANVNLPYLIERPEVLHLNQDVTLAELEALDQLGACEVRKGVAH